jgi:hypothetical protein
MRTSVIVLLLVLTACAHGARKVDCEAHLTAINPPTPVVKAASP